MTLALQHRSLGLLQPAAAGREPHLTEGMGRRCRQGGTKPRRCTSASNTA